MRSLKQQTQRPTRGFTIVELLIVIVVIGILATITIVAYNGIQGRAIAVTLQSDLTNASDKLKIYQATNNSFPTALDANNCPTAPVADSTTCLKTSPNNTFSYSSNGTTFNLTETNTNGVQYNITDSTTVAAGIACPTGFIPVPGSSTYGTSNFCVMKYAASNVSGVATSVAGNFPWVNISQTTAATTATAACSGCHLITEPEWLTIAQNVLGVASNWSGNAVGSGSIYSGHNDNAPGSALAPDPNDANGYAGETNTGGNQRRTLTLSNGQVIWDLAGNVWEWTSGTSTTGQPGISGETGYNWKEWTAITAAGSLSPSPTPGTTNLPGSSSWNSTNGVGQLYSYSGETALRGFLRSGDWSDGGMVGVLALHLNYAPSSAFSYFGFRVSR